MSKYELSVIIPARNEAYLKPTIESVLKERRRPTEIIIILDGAWPVEPLEDHPDVTILHHAQSIGQRAAINEAARLSTADWIIKLDAHCRVSEGFDEVLIRDGDYETTYVPTMYNLHVFDWKCSACGNRTYQGPQPSTCQKCGDARGFEKVMVFEPRWSRKSEFYRFDKDLTFGYWGAYKERADPEAQTVDTMSLLGACFFMNRKRYWELGGSDEQHGSWGNQGTEISCLSWLSGGRLATHRGAWFSHLFRTQPSFGFPYPMSQSAVDRARAYSRDKWLNNKFKKQVRPLSWIIEKFAPVPSWNDEEGKDALEAVNRAGEEFYRTRGTNVPKVRTNVPAVLTKRSGTAGIIYYTENRCPEPIFTAAQVQLKRAARDLRIVSVSLKPIDFGDNIVLGLTPGPVTLFKQILAGLSELDTDWVFFAEHDCLYPREHFDFIPPTDDAFYYDQHTWKVNAETGQALFYYTQQVSGLCANRELLIGHYRRRIERCEQNAADLIARGEPVRNEGFSQHLGWEPGNHTPPRGVDNYPARSWWGAVPIVDIRHTRNLSKTRWSVEEFRDKRTCEGWRESGEIPFWGRTEGRFDEFLREVIEGRVLESQAA